MKTTTKLLLLLTALAAASCTTVREVVRPVEVPVPVIARDSTTTIIERTDSVSHWQDITEEMRQLYGAIDSTARFYGRERVIHDRQTIERVIQDTTLLCQMRSQMLRLADAMAAADTQHREDLAQLRRDLTPSSLDTIMQRIGFVATLLLAVIGIGLLVRLWIKKRL